MLIRPHCELLKRCAPDVFDAADVARPGCVVDMNNSRTVRLLASWQESGGNVGVGRNRSGVSRAILRHSKMRGCQAALLVLGTGLSSFFALALAVNSCLTFWAMASVSTLYSVAASLRTLAPL